MKIFGAVRLAAVLTLALISGCATLSGSGSYSEQVARAYAGVAVANDTAAILLNSDVINKATAQQVLLHTREATAAIDIASDLGATLGQGNLVTALEALRLATDLLCKDRPTNPNCQYLTQRVQL